MAELTSRYYAAVAFAGDLHRDQVRKGTDIPYLAHLMSVSALVLEARGDEDLAIAGLLHDALEDQPDRTSFADLAARFGRRVADIVRACSDTEEQPKPPWRQRKTAYLAHLEQAEPDVLVVSLADKLHNARAITADYSQVGERLWQRFHTGSGQDQLWYYRSLLNVFARQDAHPMMLTELRRTLDTLAAMMASGGSNVPAGG